MSTITFEEMLQNPHTFLQRIGAGESLLILQANKPVAKLTPLLAPAGTPNHASLQGSVLKYEAPFESALPYTAPER